MSAPRYLPSSISAARRLADAALPPGATVVFVATLAAMLGAAGATLDYDYEAYLRAASGSLKASHSTTQRST